jgi:lambda family phage portal protein
MDNVIGTGLKLKVSIDNDLLEMPQEEAFKLAYKIEHLFKIWSKDCDYYQISNFYELQYQIYFEYLINGECFANTPYKEDGAISGLKIQLIESECVENPNFTSDTFLYRNGVKIDKNGIPVAYSVRHGHPQDPWNIPFNWKEMEIFGSASKKRRFLHIFRQERPLSYRGISPFSACLISIKQIERLTDAELMASVLSANLTFMIKHKTERPPSPLDDTNEPMPQEITETKLSCGTALELYEGEEVTTVNPIRPNSQYAPFKAEIERDISASQGISAEMSSLKFASSYSASKAEIAQSDKRIMVDRMLVINKFCEPIFDLFIEDIVSKGLVEIKNWENPLVKASIMPRWIGVPRGELDENKAITAALDRINNGLSTRQIEAEKMSGEDWINLHKQLTVENAARLKDGLVGTIPASADIIRMADMDDVKAL